MGERREPRNSNSKSGKRYKAASFSRTDGNTGHSRSDGHTGNANRHQSNSFIPQEELFPYKEYELKEGAYREVMIINISNPNSFYVRITENEQDLKKMKDDMAQMANQLKKVPRLVRGMPVIYTTQHGKYLHRGLVQDPRENRLELVDLGRHQSCNPNYMYQIEPDSKLLKYPKFAVKCALTEDQPFTLKTLERFRQDFIECKFLVQFKKKIEKNRYLVVLLHYELITAFDMLKIFIDRPVCSFKTNEIEFGKTYDITVLKRLSDNTGFVAFTDEKTKWDKLRREFCDYYSRLDNETYHYKSEELQEDLPIACKYGDTWYRASVKEFLPESKASVILVDVGDTVEISVNSAKKLLDYFATVPPLAIRCTCQMKPFPKPRFNCRFVSKDDNGYVIEPVVKETTKTVVKGVGIKAVDPIIIDIMGKLLDAVERVVESSIAI